MFVVLVCSIVGVYDACSWRCSFMGSILGRCVSEFSVCFASFDVVCDEFETGVWDVCLV